jgi:RNA polymerase sigma-70 factor, ECF subfamily
MPCAQPLLAAIVAPAPGRPRQRFAGAPRRWYGSGVMTEGEPPAPVDAPWGGEDAALMAAVAGGDRAALATLYDRHGAAVVALLQRILHDRALAEDLLHDVFLEAWHQAAGYDPQRGSVRTWLMIRARSRALDRRSKLQRDAQLAELATRDRREPVHEAGEVVGLDGARLRRLAAGLSRELVEVIELAYFEGLSSSQIAETLCIPVGTVKSRVARALEALRAAFGTGAEGGP